ncbi:MAG: hypothetical protein AAF383_04850 [Cyanobacteria bacterium P01_A01_bin.83]
MTTPADRERELQLREAQLQAKEQELRLRELETEIYQEPKTFISDHNSAEPPFYQTTKHKQKGGLHKFGLKLVKFTKFVGFVVAGIAIMKVGFLVGMWITYLILTGIIAAIGYSIFLKDN